MHFEGPHKLYIDGEYHDIDRYVLKSFLELNLFHVELIYEANLNDTVTF